MQDHYESMITPGKRLLSWLRYPGPVLLGGLILLGFLYIAETMPRPIRLPVPPPDYYEGRASGSWMRETSAVLTEPPGLLPERRVFIWRTETLVSPNSAHGRGSWDAIISYFDERLGALGWARGSGYAPCRVYLDEAKFLQEGQPNGYVNFRRKEYRPYHDLEQSDVICVAAWSDDPEVFHVVLLTGRSSYLSMLIAAIFR